MLLSVLPAVEKIIILPKTKGGIRKNLPLINSVGFVVNTLNIKKLKFKK